jgi:hypothetical protein
MSAATHAPKLSGKLKPSFIRFGSFFLERIPLISLDGVFGASPGLLWVTARVLHGMDLFTIHHEVPGAKQSGIHHSRSYRRPS